MADISAQLVKQLREMTGAGLMDCKRALQETAGQAADDSGWMDLAADWLRAKGISKAAKKAGRIAADGLIGIATSGTTAALVEVNSETDFVARNEGFMVAVRGIAAVALKENGDVTKVAHGAAPDGDGTVNEMLQRMVATIGENMTLRRAAALSVSDGVVAVYLHNKAPGADDLGKIGVLVALESTGDKARVTDIGRKVAMHIASAKPLAATTADLDPKVVEKEKAILTEQANESGKPANVIEKMVEGRIRKFYQESVLVEQAFVMDPDVTVGKYIEKAAKELGAAVTLKGFVKFEVGEGIEKAVDDFAAEVASMQKK